MSYWMKGKTLSAGREKVLSALKEAFEPQGHKVTDRGASITVEGTSLELTEKEDGSFSVNWDSDYANTLRTSLGITRGVDVGQVLNNRAVALGIEENAAMDPRWAVEKKYTSKGEIEMVFVDELS